MQPALPITRIFEGVEAVARLAELGIDAADLRDVVLTGEYARAEATANDPVTASGSDAYRYRVRAFRDTHVVEKGWQIVRENGLEITRSADGKVSVITRAGNEAVGMRDGFPQPKRPVGKGTEDVFGSDTLLLDANWMNAQRKNLPNMQIWMLLVSRKVDVVRYELSLPSGIEGGEVLGWVERILGPEIDLNAPAGRTTKTEEPPAAIDVPVAKKKR